MHQQTQQKKKCLKAIALFLTLGRADYGECIIQSNHHYFYTVLENEYFHGITIFTVSVHSVGGRWCRALQLLFMQLYRTRLLVLYTTVARSTKRSAALVTHPSYFVATSSLPNKLSFVRTMVATRRSMATTTALPATPKRKRKVETSSIITPSPRKQTKNLAKQKTEKTSNETTSPNKKTTKSPKPPADWEQIYSLVEELRQDRTAPCDESGCEALPDRSGTDRDFRFQALISLMLSSQTKDATVGEAIRRMQEAGVLNVQDIAGMDAATLNSYINKVGL